MNMIYEKIKEEYEVGQKIFKELFQLTDGNLRKKLIEIIGASPTGDHEEILNNSDCVRTIKNGEPEKIEFRYYDGVKINWSGIIYIPEHGPDYNIVKFNKFFKL